jgi:ribonuclease P protein component
VLSAGAVPAGGDLSLACEVTAGVLSPASRLRRSEDFRAVLRRGRRAGRPLLVASLLLSGETDPPRVGFVVSRAVGGSVVRSRVARRLRHQMRPRLACLPTGSRLVVRALPPAAGAGSAELGADLDAALQRLTRPR